MAASQPARSTRRPSFAKARKEFCRLVADADSLRATLACWQDCLPALQQRVATEIEPLFARYRAARLRLVMQLHEAVESRELSKRQKAKATEIVCWHLEELLAEEPEDTLLALHERYSTRQSAVLPGTNTARLEQTAHPGAGGRHSRNTTEAGLVPALDEKLARGAGEAVREIYRKLASKLHPDREPDERERLRKTALMQQANQAYADSDLLTLLGLQSQSNPLDDTAVQTLAGERLAQCNYLLAEQCRQLRHAVHELTAPFAASMGRPPEGLTPEAVARALDREARELKRAARDCEADVVQFRNIHHLQAALEDYRLGDVGPDSPTTDDVPEAPVARGRRRRRKR